MALRKRYSRDKKSFVYMVDYYDEQGNRLRFSTGTSNRKVAEKILKRKIEELALKRVGVTPPEPEQKVKLFSLVEFKESYTNYLIANRREQGTIELYERALDSLMEALDIVNIQDITVRDIEGWKSYSLKRVSPTTVNIYQRALKSIFNTAKKLDYIPRNPWQDVEVVAPSYDDEVPKIFEDNEIGKLFTAIDEKWMEWMVKHYLYTGMRREECIHLEAEDYDFKRELLHIRNKSHLNFKTKTKKNRVVPINKALASVIKEMNTAGEFPKSGLVFRARREPHGIINADWLARKFKKSVIKAGLDQELTLHNLRHSYATKLLQKGASLYAVSQLLGHSSVKTTEKYYAHAIPSDFRSEADLIDFEDPGEE